MARRVHEFPQRPRRLQRGLFDPLVVEAVDRELWDSAYAGDDHDRRLLALDILKAIDEARRA